MWKKKGFKGIYKGVYRMRGKYRELRLVPSKRGLAVREYPSWQAAKEAGWIYLGK